MSERKEKSQFSNRDGLEPYTFLVTPEWNEQYLYAAEDYHPRYLEETDSGPPLVHAGLLLNQSNLTRSPSFGLKTGMAGVHAKEEVEFLNPGRVGKKFRVTWRVVEEYEKRDKLYTVIEALIVDEDRREIMRRRTHGVITKGQK
jgi:thymidylate synthase